MLSRNKANSPDSLLVISVLLRGILSDAIKIVMPVFLVLTGLAVGIRDFGACGVLVAVVSIMAACTAKRFNGSLTANACKMSSQDSWSLGLLMRTRDLTNLVFFTQGELLGCFLRWARRSLPVPGWKSFTLAIQQHLGA